MFFGKIEEFAEIVYAHLCELAIFSKSSVLDDVNQSVCILLPVEFLIHPFDCFR